MKKYIFTLIVVLLFASAAFGVASNRVYYHIAVMDQWGEIVTSPAITQVDVQNESGVAVAVYSTKFGSTEVGSTGVISSGLSDGMTEFWYAGNAIDLTVTDGNRTYEIESFSVRTSRFMLPSFLRAVTSYNLGETDDLDFTYASWIIDGDTLNRLDMIPDNDGAILAIGDGTTEADVYIFSDSTSDYWLFDEGAGEVYHENIDLQFGDQDVLYFGADNDASIIYDETTDDNLEITAASVGMSITTNDLLITLDNAAADQFKVDATGTINGDAINFETSSGGIMLNADGSDYGDIELNSADDMIITSAGDTTVTTTGTWFADTTGQAKLTSSSNAASSVLITEDGGTSGQIRFHADTGTHARSIYALSDVGGISVVASAGSIGLTATGASAGDMTFTVGDDFTNTVTGIYFADVTGQAKLTSSSNAASSVLVTEDGGTSGQIRLHADTGTHARSIYMLSDVGGISTVASAGSVGITATGASAGDITLTAGDDLTLAVTGSCTLGKILSQRYITVYSTNASLSSDQSGGVLATTAGSGTQIYQLPTAAAGLVFTFVDVSATAGDDLVVWASSGDGIGTAPSVSHNAYYCQQADSVPATLKLVAADASSWLILEKTGTWIQR